MSCKRRSTQPTADPSLAHLACPNADCSDFNRFAAGNLTVAQRGGHKPATRRLYCRSCGQRFSERQGTLLEGSKLPVDTVVRIVIYLGHGCTVEATADICEVDARTVERLLAKAGPRAEDFHNLHVEKIDQVEAVPLDEWQGLTDQVWTVQEYVRHPVHLSDRQRAIWAEDREKAITSPLKTKKRPKIVPKS